LLAIRANSSDGGQALIELIGQRPTLSRAGWFLLEDEL
jgi:hypothetical protein